MSYGLWQNLRRPPTNPVLTTPDKPSLGVGWQKLAAHHSLCMANAAALIKR